MNLTLSEYACLTGRTFENARAVVPAPESEQADFNTLLSVADARLTNLLGVRTLDDFTENQAKLAKLLLARLVEVLLLEQAEMARHGIASKVVEDFRINYDAKASSPMRMFVTRNSDILAKLQAPTKIIAGRTDYPRRIVL